MITVIGILINIIVLIGIVGGGVMMSGFLFLALREMFRRIKSDLS